MDNSDVPSARSKVVIGAMAPTAELRLREGPLKRKGWIFVALGLSKGFGIGLERLSVEAIERVTFALLLLALWSRGAYCPASNACAGRRIEADFSAIQFVYPAKASLRPSLFVYEQGASTSCGFVVLPRTRTCCRDAPWQPCTPPRPCKLQACQGFALK